MHDLLLQYTQLLYKLFLYDVSIFSQKWLLVTVVPACIYLVFFFVKWVVLTTPVWLPLSIVFHSLSLFRRK